MVLYSSKNIYLIDLFTRLVPRFLHPPFAFFTGFLFYLFSGTKRRMVRTNLQVVTGKKNIEGLVISMFYKYARNWTDVMLSQRAPSLKGLFGRRTRHQPLDTALAAGNGAILVSIHLGNWELGGQGLAELGYPINVLTFREPDEKVNLQRERVRTRRGINLIYVDRNDTSPLAIVEAVNALRRNEVLALLGDRDGSFRTATFTFFDRPSHFPLGAAYLALTTGAPIIPVFVPLEKGRYATIMEEPIYIDRDHYHHETAIREGTEKLLRVFERHIKAFPDQWYNFFDFWRLREKKETNAPPVFKITVRPHIAGHEPRWQNELFPDSLTLPRTHQSDNAGMYHHDTGQP